MTPISVNHYKRPRKYGRGYFVTEEAESFFAHVRHVAAGRTVPGKAYKVRVEIHFGPRQKGDIDNFSKVAIDSLTRAGVIESDDKIQQLEMEKFSRDSDESPHRDNRNRTLDRPRGQEAHGNSN